MLRKDMHEDHQRTVLHYRDQINLTLENLLRGQGLLHDAVSYILLNGGKRLRPIFVLASVDAFGEDYKKALEPACAIECIHCSSLIHDDLPCMDDDAERRGKPTLHVKFNEALAVLAGDFLLTLSSAVASQAPFLSDKQRLQLIRAMADKTLNEGLLHGQVNDIEFSNQPKSLDFLLEIYRGKTGALFGLAFEFAAIIAEKSEEIQLKCVQAGESLGIGFQILDDVLDYQHPELKHGIKSDLEHNKMTSVSLLGENDAQALADQQFERARSLLREIEDCNPTLLISMIDEIHHSGGTSIS